jgi:hypothetical protein
MRRVLLVLAMLISLWPVAVLTNAAIAGSSGSSKRTSDNGTSSPRTSSPTAGQPDYAGLKRLQDRESQLLQRLHNSQALHGVPDSGIAQAAGQLVVDYQAWRSSNSGLDARADKIDDLEATVAQRVDTFASHPSQAALNAFNQAVAAYNANVSTSAP